MNNKNIGCLGWGIIIFAILFAVTYWQIGLIALVIIAAIWWYRTRSPQAKERQQKQRVAQQEAEAERQKNIKVWESEDLAPLASKIEGIKLHKTEYCYYHTYDPITWTEFRHRTKRVNYHGLTSNVHIMKGLNYRMGSIATDLQSEEYSKPIITGNLFLTNKRIIIYSSDGIKAYPFTRLIRAKPYLDGVALFSEAGKKVILSGFKDATQFNVFLDRLTSE